MATKISELDLIASLATSDVLPVVDVSGEVTNKCTVAQILALASEGLSLPLLLDTDDADALIKIGPDPSGGTYPAIGIIRSELQSNGVDRVLIGMKNSGGTDIPFLSHDWVRFAIGATWDQSDLSAGVTTRISKIGMWAATTEVYSDRLTLTDDRDAYVRFADWTKTKLTTSNATPTALGLTAPAVFFSGAPYAIFLQAQTGGSRAEWIYSSVNGIVYSRKDAALSTADFDGTNVTGIAGTVEWRATGAGPYYAPSGGSSITDSASLRALLSDETGTGVAVFANSPTLNSPQMVTPKISDSAGGQFYNFAVSNLAADRTVTLPLLTGNDEFVFAAHAVTLTNKTMSGASNTFSNIPITALTGSSADLRGALSDETGTGACVFADAPVPTGTWSWASGGAIGFTGGTAHATSGMIRVPYAATQTIIGARTSATSTVALLSSIAADNYQLGDATAFNMDIAGANTNIVASSTLSLYGGNVLGVTLGATQLSIGRIVSGRQGGSIPFRFARTAIVQGSTADTTLTAAQYECPIIDVSGTPGGNFNVIAPNNEGAFFIVKNRTANTLTIKKSGGTGVTVATASQRVVFHDGSDYVYGSG